MIVFSTAANLWHNNWNLLFKNRTVKKVVNTMLKTGFFVAGLLGIIIFFPVNISDTYTCLAHKLTVPSSSIYCEMPAKAKKSTAITKTSFHEGDKHHLLSRYLIPFAFLWWGSIGLFLFQLKSIRAKNTLFKYRKKDKI